jgi:predicted enzyme related to lactoylglutathione lyase
MSPTVPGMENAPHVWSVYLATDDISAMGAAAGASGAHEIYPPMQVGSFGWMGMWADPTGASFGAWQSIEHTGVTVFDEHGALAWCDLVTGDPAAAQGFYAGVFGYSYEEIGMEGAPYALFTVPGGERPAGGIGALDPSWGSTPGWTVCFGHDDVDAAAASVTAAGGRVLREPYDFQFGRLMHAVGPDGEQFSMITALPMG